MRYEMAEKTPEFQLNDIPQSTSNSLWLWLGLGITALLLFDTDKKQSSNRLSGYTATCLKFGKNRLGRKQCLKYSPTCGSADEGCRVEAAPLPSEIGKRTQKDYEIEADALAQELANEKNFELDYNKKIRNEILAYGGIAPHRGGFMSEEYKMIPTKYKREDGIPLDELAQEMGTDEATLTDRIYQAEAQFQELKDMRGGKTTTRFKKADFIDEAWNRMRSGRGFFGRLREKQLIEREGTDIQPFFKGDTNEVWFIDTMPRYNERLKDWFHSVYELDSRGNYKPAKMAVSTDSLKEQFLPGLKKTKIKEPQLTLFGELGYKGYDEEGAINATVKNIAKFQGKPAYIFATYTGIKTKSQKPPYGQQYYRVNPDGSADYVEYSKGVTTEKRIRHGFMGLGDMPSYDYTSFVPNREYNAFMRKLQDTALDLLEKTHRKDIERTQGSIKISTTPGSPTFNQARSMVYPGFEAIFFEAIYNNMDKKKHNAVYQALRDEQTDIQSRQARRSEQRPVKKVEKMIPEKKEQMTLFGELKRDLSETQERQLFSWYLKHDFSYPTTNLRETMRVLLDKKYLKEQNKNLFVTDKGEEYCDQYHMSMPSISRPKTKERLTPFEKEMLERKLAEELKPKQPKGQMTLFGGSESLKHDVFRWKVGSKQMEVIKNPTASEIRQISDEFQEKYPRSTESGIRTTYDQYDNKYIWNADTMHSDVEPMINVVWDVYTHQSQGMAKWLLDAGMTTKKKMTFFGGIKFNPDVTENQIRARVIQPTKIIKGTFFVRTSTTPGVSYVMGQDKSGRVMTQSIRFDRHTFDNRSAKRWFDSNIKRIKQRDRQGYVYLIPSLSGGKTHSEDYFSPRQQEMFPGLRRELALEQEDSANIFTVDPLDVCLERQGWDIPKVRKYQQNISAKMTPDMFGKIQRLTGAEIMLQEQIQKCLERR